MNHSAANNEKATLPTKPTLAGLLIAMSLACSLVFANEASLPVPEIRKPVLAPMPRLSPRPTHVAGVKVPTVDLNGVWHWRSPWVESDALPTASTNGWSTIEVPSEYRRQGKKLDNAAAMFRTFEIPADWGGKRVKLRFQAVNNLIKVKVNGRQVGEFDGIFLPFEADVTDALEPGKKNHLLVELREKNWLSGNLSGRQTQGGIIRGVSLLALPDINVSRIYSETMFDKEYRDATLRVCAQIANDGNRDGTSCRMRLKLTAPDGKPIAVKPDVVEIGALKAGASSEKDVEISMVAPVKWDAEHPNLYTLEATLDADGATVEILKQRIGFRQVEVRGDQILVNGVPIKIRGVVRHKQHRTRGCSLPPEMDRSDPLLFRDANCNYIRSWPAAEDLYDTCDEAGVYIHGELPISGYTDNTLQPKMLRDAELLVTYLRRHPSVIIWSLGNESRWGPSFPAAGRRMKELDATRPVTFCQHSGSRGGYDTTVVEIDTEHYPGVGIGRYANRARPIYFTEYVHVNCYNPTEFTADPAVRDRWGEGFRMIWEVAYPIRSIAGGCLFAGVDYTEAGVRDEWPWGVIDGWHRPKPEYWHMKKVYSPIHIADAPIAEPNGGELRIPVENRYDTTNLREIRTEWRIGGKTGVVSVDVPPRSKGVIVVPYDPAAKPRTLSLRFHSPLGFLVDAYELPVGTQPPPPSPRPGSNEKPTLTRKGDGLLIVSAGNVKWTIDEKTARIVSGSVGADMIVSDGPCPFIGWFGGIELLADWAEATVSARQTGAVVEVSFDAEGTDEIEAKSRKPGLVGSLTYRFDGAGNVDIAYSLKWSGTRKEVRELGMAFSVGKNCDTLSWKRKGLWSVYPEDHIGRIEGVARAFRTKDPLEPPPGQAPSWSWALDSTEMGTADFRSTKANVTMASLTTTGGKGLVLESDGSQHVRAFVDKGSIRFLVKEYSGSGSDKFAVKDLNDKLDLKPDATIKGTVRLAIRESGTHGGSR